MPVSLAEHIRSKLNGGRLPSALPAKMWTRYGHGNACDGCDQPVDPAHIEYEFLLDSGDVFRFHIGCLGMWLAELRRRGRAGGVMDGREVSAQARARGEMLRDRADEDEIRSEVRRT